MMGDYEVSRCDLCDHQHTCELANIINFCDDCRYKDECTIRDVACDAGYDIECNNGFELSVLEEMLEDEDSEIY